MGRVRYVGKLLLALAPALVAAWAAARESLTSRATSPAGSAVIAAAGVLYVGWCLFWWRSAASERAILLISRDYFETLRELAEELRQSDRTARGVLDRWHRERAPYALLLRNFGIEAEGVLTRAPAGNPFITHTFTYVGYSDYDKRVESRLARAFPPYLPLIMVANPADMIPANRLPALLLDESKWKGQAAQLMADAALVVVEAQNDTPGVRTELTAIQQMGKQEHTIVVLPDESGGADRIREMISSVLKLDGAELPPPNLPEDLLAHFPHRITADCIPDQDLEGTPPFRGLLEQIRPFATMSTEQRELHLAGMRRDREGAAMANEGRTEEALVALTDAVALLERAGDPGGLIRPALNVGHMHLRREEWEPAEHWYQRSRAAAEAAGRPAETARALSCLGNLRLTQERVDEADQIMSEALAILEEDASATWVRAFALRTRASIQARRGEPHNAAATLSASALSYALAGDVGEAIELLRTAATMAAQSGHPDCAAGYARSAAVLAEAAGAPELAAGF